MHIHKYIITPCPPTPQIGATQVNPEDLLTACLSTDLAPKAI